MIDAATGPAVKPLPNLGSLVQGTNDPQPGDVTNLFALPYDPDGHATG